MDDPLMLDLEAALNAEAAVDELPADAGFKERIATFASLESLRRDLEDALDRVKKRISSMESTLLEEMAQYGIETTRVNGMTIYSRVDRFVRKKPEKSGVTTDMICDALRTIGRGDMVSDDYSASSLKSLVVEMIAEQGSVPDELAKLLEIGEQIRLVTRR